MIQPQIEFEPYAAAVRKLLKGVVYHDDPVWIQIRDYEFPIREYFNKIGLDVHLDNHGSFAYVYDQSRDDDQASALPALTSRQRLSFGDTLLLVLLRERLDEHETRDLDGARLVLSSEELIEMIAVFLGDHPDVRKVESSGTSSIKRLARSGFLTERRDGRFEVRPLIRAKVSADELVEIKARLARFIHQDEEETEDDDDESR